jgi:hypothetical protein
VRALAPRAVGVVACARDPHLEAEQLLQQHLALGQRRGDLGALRLHGHRRHRHEVTLGHARIGALGVCG